MKIRGIFPWSLFTLISGFVAAQQCLSPDYESVLHTNNAYTYHFRSVAVAQAVGTTEDTSKIALECDAHVSHSHTCIFILELRKCEVTASGGQPGSEQNWIDRQPLPGLSKYHVEFSLMNGKIGDVKAHQDEPLYYLNIKRGVLSSFVFKLSQTQEELQEVHTDIHGSCPLTSIPVDDADAAAKTSKDMLQCHFPSRPDWQFSPWSLFWNMSFIQYVINSTTDCDYKVSSAERRIERVFCKERHAIMLESTHKTATAVQTNIYYYMDFVKSEVQTSKPSFSELSRKTDIRFEYEDTPMPLSSPPDFLPAARKMMSDLVQDSFDEVRLFTIPQFTDFVAWIRSSHDLTELVDNVRSCAFLSDGVECSERIKELAFSYLSDALVQCSSIPCAKAITHLARSNDLSPVYLNFVFHSWSFMHYSKPGFLTNFMDICKLKNSGLCWMSVGNLIHRIYSRNGHLSNEMLKEAKEIGIYIHSRMEEDCDDTDDNPSLNCLAFMKAARNIGKYYVQLAPNAVSLLVDFAANDHSPVFVRTSALEAIKDVFESNSTEQNRMIYDNLLPLLKNSSLPTSLRVLAYEQLLLVSDGYHFEEHLLKILKDEKNVEVRYYIAKSLNSLRADYEFRTKRNEFIKSLDELLSENSLSLEWILYESKGKSHSSTRQVSLNLPFLPDSMKRFGLKLADAAIYDSHVYPALFNQESILELFSFMFPATKLESYFEGWEEILLTYQKNLADMNSKSPTYSDIYTAIVETLSEYDQNKQADENSNNFNENIIRNVKKLHELYWQHHKKISPYAKSYMDLFGSTLKYFTLEKFQSSNKEMVKLMRSLRRNLEDGATYNTTRVIRIIEAYHQVPTMMGLPLNWTTNATLAFSLRTGLKLKFDETNQISSKALLQPSAALTFMNRMVLDFPTLTQIGIQANSSGYSSTEFRIQYHSSKGKQTLRFERPSRTQKVLELFRTNQIIKHNNYNDIPDWDIQRTETSWCTENINTGIKFCFAKSYPNVTHRIKPWALMAGSCKWQFLMHPVDRNDVYYDVELQQTEKQKMKEYATKFSIIGSGKDQNAQFTAIMDENGKDFKYELKTTAFPDFSASLVRSGSSNNKVSGYKMEGTLKLHKDFKYEVMYSTEGQVKQPGNTKTAAAQDENNQILLDEEELFLQTPYASYKWNKSVFIQGENTKAEVSLLYENLESKEPWIKKILPPSFWENERKASFKVNLNWKKPIFDSSDTVTRRTEFRLTIPRYIITLTGDAVEMKNREQINVNLAKMDINRKELDTFLNFTYDFWQNDDTVGNRKIVTVFNITIPRRSWSLTSQILLQASKFQLELKLKRALMTSNNDVKSDYVGWWSKEVSDRFRVEEQEIKLVADAAFQPLATSELLNEYPTLTGEDFEVWEHFLIESKITFYYLISDRVESVVFDGYLISSYGRRPFRGSRYQKDFVLTSSYNNLQLTSHTVYKAKGGSSVLNHSSYLTHTTTETKAYNTIFYTRTRPEGECPQYAFQHDIKSHVFDLSTNATYKCAPGDDDLYTLLLKMNTNSSKWDMLNMKLDQIIQDVSHDYSHEDCTITHPLGTIHVDAEWHGKKESQKRVVVCSKKGRCPNFELLIENFQGGKRSVKISLPNQNESQITYDRQMSPDYKNLHMKIGYSSQQNPLSNVIDFTGEIIARNYHVWKGMIDVNTYNKVKDLLTSGYNSIKSTVISVARDKDHPLNEILKPALKITLYDYCISLKKQVSEFFSDSWNEVKEIFYTLETFAEPAHQVLINSVVNFKDQCQSAYYTLKEKSVTIWAIHYFDIPFYLREGFTNLHRGVSELILQLTLGEENLLHFKFITGKMLSLRSFRSWPSISFYPAELIKILQLEEESSMPVTKQHSKEKIALIFGPHHVYTFDGLLYRFPEYPSKDCMFLLAHDIHKSLFSVLSSEKSIHILFPEMSVSINEHNEVFINESSHPTSLPIQAGNGKVSVKGGHIVEVWSPSLSIICSSRDFLCLLKMAETHAGGIMGLLGNADGYLNNDYMLPNGITTLDTLDFVRSYEISGKTACKNLALNSKPSPLAGESQLCPQHLGSICFKKTAVHQRFLEACTSDVREGNGPCYAASGLSALCHLKYMPSHTECNVRKQQNEKIGHNLEVVLVVQQSKYLASSEKAGSPVKGIESIIQAIDVKFKENGYSSVKFSLVGFGGNGVRHAPTIHSSEKEIWYSADTMVRDGLKTLEFKSKDEANAVQALKHALDELGHDTFDSKVFIVIAIKDKQVTEKHLTGHIQNYLEWNGITLYTISSYPSIEKGKKVFGVRADGLLFPSQAKGSEAYLNYPRGSLAKLTSSTRGSLFLSKFVRDNHPSSFFTEFAQEVWAKIRKETTKCRSCRSVKSEWWWYVNECKIVDC